MAGTGMRLDGVRFVPGIGLALLLVVQQAAADPGTHNETAPGAGSSTSAPVLPTRPGLARPFRMADFQEESASSEVRHVAHWAVDSGDNGGLPYVIVDKVNAKVFVFDADGRLKGVESALLGMERGDGTAKGLGNRKLSAIPPGDRTTPAGRYVASLASNLQGQSILWIDYASALALHRVVKGKPTERRAQRLQSATSEDNRISYGCINVPVNFFEKIVTPAFSNSNGIVYILPETGTARELFGSHDVNDSAQGRNPAPP